MYAYPGGDFPSLYVARRFRIGPNVRCATDDVITATSLDALRAKLPPGLTHLERDEADDKVIVELWI